MSINLNMLETEQVNPNSQNIDVMDTIDILHVINEEDQTVALSVKKVLPKVAELVDRIHVRMMKGGRVIYIGAGTSGRLGVLDASECPPTYGVDPSLIQGLIAGGFGALLKAQEGAEDDTELAKGDLQKAGLTTDDTVIGLAASGRTPYVIGGLDYANSIGALTGAISCVHNAKISEHADTKIEAIVGPEVITGSTRMKAGTAQKMILNMISTSLMIKYGKVYKNLMVDVQPTNEKLVERAKHIIMSSSKCSYEEALRYLEQSGGKVKIAICMAITHLPKENCGIILKNANGNISKAIRSLKQHSEKEQ
ncbi:MULTISPECIES: N-acetylmuramic acid 6-phosphate etherase [Caproicibacterium]|jgi:N-acetylmuramic acid 6-phosphate etherase|uniref:N-acetylmuramic acid 6-phosphate etherase n=1 Tax=Caproicibacterium lactatifermentans TaxID=2666138 RepID=A0A859DPS2_9FIRM|nr:N-acetylmuramic acid 6-phosphate etherase [Caproicibacterium lactatifermentans]ARP50827.1 N-acetylmuramic acid 6-phosphate etherase [Ruminococcaceae bacterium CPB6]QKN23445.1 N-acetylmuramic acid 6-phosphate etherase [Caproicibacterium lactatifermentans]QKO29877.1 N-acetylmuramic acid 6-phosphate etherase [Caproicibacterium lactatifermentans]